MKKIIYLFSALALMAGFTACSEKENGGDINLDDLVLDGFYVYGEATGAADKVLAQNAMAAGANEVDKAVRTGMYEKYIWLEAGKDFSLIENQAGVKKFYGADLVEVNYGYDENDPNCKNFADNPNMIIQQGLLVVGENAPKMQVKETGLYHIVLDNNAMGDLADGAQIIVQKADWGVRGGMNGWGFTKGEATQNEDGSITYTLVDQKLAAGGEFKFASCHGWKINLDVDGTVKAEVSLGLKDGKLSQTGDNIAVEKGGLYTISLTYTPKAGAVADSFSYTCTLTQESTTPTTMYIIGNEFGNWDWSAASVVTMTNVYGQEGCFWAIRYMTTATEFKFCALKEWNGDFCTLPTTNEGFVTPGNNKVEADGLYLIYVNVVDGIVKVQPAKVWGMGDVFGGWDVEKYAFNVAADGKASLATKAAGNLRMYASVPGVASGDWWQAEFNIYDGKIVYRGNGGDQAAVAVGANQTVTLDFNAGTGSIK